MVTLPQLRDARFADLDRSAAQWSTFACGLDAAARCAAAVSAPLRASGWAGADADAAANSLARRGESVLAAAREARFVVTALEAASDRLRAAQNALRALLDEAARGGFTVSDEGRVRIADRMLRVDGGADVVSRQLELERCLAESVRAATEADGQCAQTLAKLRPANAADWTDIAADGAAVMSLAGVDIRTIPTGGPATAARWWASLTRAQQRAYVALHPALVGALDGIPTAVRDSANRMALAEAKTALCTELNATRAARDVADRLDDPRLRFRCTELAGRLAAIESLERTLRSGGDMYLMGFDARGDGKAIVAIGNPDRAAHTAVYVPGTGAGLDGIGDDVLRIRNLAAASGRYLQKQGDLSVIAWVGYDAPDTLVEAVGSSSATSGASSLADFSRGLGVTQGVNTNHQITLIGHSYGSVVIGEALTSGTEIPVRDIVVAGSPGMHVQRAADLTSDARHVWVAAARGDVVPYLGSGAHAPEIPGSHHRATPDVRSFGANRIRTDGANGHSSYWEEDNPTSLDNQAAIIIGRYKDVSLIWGTAP